jgi:NADH dehydrogenase
VNDVVTGAYGYTGRYLTERLLDAGHTVRTITGNPSRADPFGGRVEAFPFSFDDPARLVETLRGADTLYNTYWVRFSWQGTTYDQAVENTRTLFAAAKEAGVRRVVHVSITNPTEGSPLPYFHGKAVLERELRESGLSYAIVRPTVVFGREDILINNVAWLLRRLPLFVIPGDGSYRLQPIYVEDLAKLLADAGAGAEDTTFDAVGPETYAFEELVRLVRGAVGSRARLVHAPAPVALVLGRLVSRVVRDVLITPDELRGLADDLLVSSQPPTGSTSFRGWVRDHAGDLGRVYASELARHYRR